MRRGHHTGCRIATTGFYKAPRGGEKGNIRNVPFVMRTGVKVASERPVRAWGKVALCMIGKKADIDSRSKQGHTRLKIEALKSTKG